MINCKTTSEMIGAAFIVLDKKWCFTYINPMAGIILDRIPEKIIGKNIWVEIPEDTGRLFYNATQEAMKEQKYICLEEYCARTGLYFEKHIYPSPEGLLIYYNDVTEKRYPYADGITLGYSDITARKYAEQELVLSKLRMEAILENTNDVVWAIDKDYKYIYFNLLAKHFIQSIAGKEIKLGFHCPDYLPKKYKAEILSDCDRAFEGEQFVTEKERNYCGINVTEEYSFNPVRDQNNEVIGVSVFMKDITQRKKALVRQKENEERYRSLVKHSLYIREEEGKRIAREIHDELGQQLTGLKMTAVDIYKKTDTSDKQIRERLSSMITIIDDTVEMVRRIASELRPGVLDDLGLIPALEWMGQDFEKRTGISVSFFTNQEDLLIEEHLSTNIFRIYQEALTNITRHANATTVETIFEKSENDVVLIIIDNGDGFNSEEVKNKNSWGLIGMRERASFMGARLDISSAKKKGTIITLRIPLLNKSLIN